MKINKVVALLLIGVIVGLTYIAYRLIKRIVSSVSIPAFCSEVYNPDDYKSTGDYT